MNGHSDPPSTESRYTMTRATMKVTIPGVVSIYQVPLNDTTWNGFAVPAFTLAQVRQLAAEFAATPAHFPEDTDVLHVEDDNTVWIDVAHDTREDLAPDPDGRYLVGAFRWAWEFVYVQCAVCGTSLPASNTREPIAHHSTVDRHSTVAFTCSPVCAGTYEILRFF